MKPTLRFIWYVLPLPALLPLSAQAQLASGTVIITNADGGTNGQGQIEKVAPGTNTVSVLSDFGNAAQGPLGHDPVSLAIIPAALLGSPTLIAADTAAGTGQNGALFAVNLGNGNRTTLSDFGNARQGPVGVDPMNVVLDNGLLGLGQRLLVLDDEAGSDMCGAIFAVNPTTGQRTLISDLGNPALGDVPRQPIQISVSSGLLGIGSTILLLDAQGGTSTGTDPLFGLPNYGGALYTVNPSSGVRTKISDFGNAMQGPLGAFPTSVLSVTNLLGLNNTLLVLDQAGGIAGEGALYLINPVTGARTLAQDFGNAAQGPVASTPSTMAVKQVCLLGLCSNTLFVSDNDAGAANAGEIFQVNSNGTRSVAIDFGLRGSALGAAPPAAAVVP